MENASKALLIAGGMLLMIMILTFSTYMFRKFGSQTAEFYKNMSDTEIYEFNQKFFKYETKNDQTIGTHEVVSVINLAKDAYKRELAPVIIEVKLNGNILNLESIDDSYLEKMLSDELKSDNEKAKYTCKVEYAENSNYVGRIEIQKNP